MDAQDHPYAPFLHRVLKPARYVGGEVNQIVKDPSTVRVRMALAFPDVYDIGMSHLGTKILYSLLNKTDDLAAERVFCPWVDMEKELRARELPLLTLETASPLRDFHVVGFSLQYELTFTNVLTMLDLSGIALRSVDRAENDPIVVAGGPVATQPEPMTMFIDAFLIGDAEEQLPTMLRRVGELREAGASRQEILVEIAKIEGFYVPSLYATAVDEQSNFMVVNEPLVPGIQTKPRRAIVEDLSRFPFPDDAPVADTEAIFDRLAVEIARGCTEGCRFCQAGMIYRPVRERDPEEIVETIVNAVNKSGYDEVGLTTLSTADYSCISPLIKKVMTKLRPEKVSLSVASLRAYGLDEDLFDEIKSVRATGLTFAPEAGTQRMRDVVNKNISEEDMITTAHRVFSRGWRRMKLYFMIGLPTETDEDVAGIMETGDRMRQIGIQYHDKGKVGITCAVSSHVPKPHTPFQWCAMDSLDEIERKQDMLFRLARRYRLEFRRHDPRTTYLECILGRGDRRVGEVIETVWRNGARFDSWDDKLNWDAWMDGLQAHDLPYEAFLGTIAVDARVPWDHLDMQLEERFLATEYKRSMKGKLSPPCGKPVGAQVHHTNLEDHEADQRLLVCYHCGVACDMTRMREERGEFLDKMQAFSPSGTSVPEGGAAAEGNGTAIPLPQAPIATVELSESTDPNFTPRKPRKKKRKEAPQTFAQGDAQRYRLRFSKHGAATLTGHLDLVRALPRMLRRAGLTPFYTQGYHPKPVMEFSPPLPLGVNSLEEYVDISLAEVIAPAVLLEKLNASAPSGLSFLDVQLMPPGSRKLSRELEAAEYLVRIDADALAASPRSAAELDAAPEALLARTEILWDVSRKRVRKQADLRPSIDAVSWVDADDVPAMLRRPGARYVSVRTLLNAEGHARPEEVAQVILGYAALIEPPHIMRRGLVTRDASGWRTLVSST